MSFRQERVLKRLQDLDRQAEKANSLWHSLEGLKMSIAKDEHMSASFLREHHIFVGEERDRTHGGIVRYGAGPDCKSGGRKRPLQGSIPSVPTIVQQAPTAPEEES